MTHRRGIVEINYAILSCLHRMGALRSTHLMYKVNITHTRVKSYTAKLIAAGYVRFENRRYFLTEKGLLYLSVSREFFMLAEDLKKDYREREVLIVK